MEHRSVELIGGMSLDDRGLKERVIRAIFGPAIVPCVDVRVMEFITRGFELIPLQAGMQDLQNVVKDFVEREFGLWPFVGPVQMRVDRAIKVSPRDFRWNLMKDKCGMCSGDLGIHRPVLPDEGDICEPQKYS